MQALPPVSTVAVIGAGTMGAGIAQVAAQYGHKVLLYDAVEGAAAGGVDNIAGGLDKLVERDRITAERRKEILAQISPIREIGEIAPSKLVIEAVIEDMGIKRELFSQVEELCGEETILATNTSSLSVTALASSLKRPGRFVGMHFFNPAPIMKLVEVVSGLATDPETAAAAHATATAWGKQAVHVKSAPGFIVNRVARPFYAEALRILQEQAADIPTIDLVMKESGGFRMGPFELMDLIGNDVNFAVTNSVYTAYFQDPRFRPSLLQQEMVEAGRLGRKSGRGYYEYADNAERPEPRPMPLGNAPDRVIVEGDMGTAESLIDMLEQFGIPVDRGEGEGLIKVGDAVLALTDGRFATRRALDADLGDFLVFDLALDYAAATRIAVAASDGCSDKAKADAAGLFQALGKSVSLIDDIPGLIVARTVMMLINEGADAVNQGVCDSAAVDTAMQAGLNYPCGPMAWAGQVGLDYVLGVLGNLARIYGEDRYRVSPLLQRLQAGGRNPL